MSASTKDIRSEPHVKVGTVIERDATIVIQRWSRRAIEEHPKAQRVHHATLLDHLPQLLQELGRSLAESSEAEPPRHCRPARQHAEQRWETGWSLAEVVKDYQLLRLVLVEYLEETLDRPLRSREIMAIGLALDDAITASVNAYMREATERSRKTDEALRQQAEALAEANRRKDEFLAVLAHELRNPLAPIRNAAEVMGLQPGDRATTEWARGLLERQAQQMTRLVDDLLDASRISRGKITLQRTRLDIVCLVRDVTEDRRASVAEAGLSLALELPQVPLWVDGDATRLAQVVGNLLQNAIKFTDRGGQLTVKVTAEEGARHVRIAVHDTGIGIEPDLLPLVFETFMQGDRSLERSRGGLGLGLALVKGLAELHGGEVQATSEGVGRGAEFTVRLPLAGEPLPVGEPTSRPRRAEQPLHLLLIEDHHDSADSLKTLLELYGHKVTVAHTGAEGLEAARRQTPDVILCDLGMPGMSGYDVAIALRQDPTTASTRLMAVSGHGSETDQQRCREAGFDLHLTKPVDLDVLQELLASLPAKTEGNTAGPPGLPATGEGVE
jgi:signal transduction histidine kinase/ActR/RegA family two-component response regulator